MGKKRIVAGGDVKKEKDIFVMIELVNADVKAKHGAWGYAGAFDLVGDALD